MATIGSGLGAGGFYVIDGRTDIAAVALGVSRFLAVESCGQCEPCKRDGLAIADRLGAVTGSTATGDDIAEISDRLGTVADGARCYLAYQQERVVGSLLRYFPDAFDAHVAGRAPAAPPEPILPVIDIVDGEAVLDNTQQAKQPDWTHDGSTPAAGPPPISPTSPSRSSVLRSGNNRGDCRSPRSDAPDRARRPPTAARAPPRHPSHAGPPGRHLRTRPESRRRR
ncbi:MAG: hypothetical protein HYX32_04530 [Actinobacteria bacterium]|nr:hypothetical protein [Actinomycetota bacterium]